MPSLGKSIDLYLMDGTVTGRWQATLSNWNCIAYKIPRDDVKNCDDLPELHAPGVYFLFGHDDIYTILIDNFFSIFLTPGVNNGCH